MADRQTLGRDYLMDEEIGRGMLAIVHRAGRRLGGPPLAAKVLRPEFAADPHVRDLVIGEAAALRDLEHPAIATLRDLILEHDQLVLVTDFVDGVSLRRLLAHRGHLLTGDAGAVAAQTAAALAAAHAQGVAHLDLKPENILVVDGSQPVEIQVSDFGVAALVLGAPPDGPYTAPEVSRGGPGSPAADMYALGMVIVEMTTGMPPGLSDPASAPEPLRAVARACLMRDPRQRPAAAAVAEWLPAHARPVPPRRPTQLGGPGSF